MSYEELSRKISAGLEDIGKPFSVFHHNSKMFCPPDCGKCCFNPEIAAHPFELLPLAMNLLERGEALDYLQKLKENKDGICILLDQINAEKGIGKCKEYDFRPTICRAFGVSGRINKKEEVELSICKKLKELYPLEDFDISNQEVPFISLVKRKLESIDPVLIGPQLNINEALIIVLEKVLLWDSLKRKQ